jgi:hypothetical protein
MDAEKQTLNRAGGGDDTRLPHRRLKWTSLVLTTLATLACLCQLQPVATLLEYQSSGRQEGGVRWHKCSNVKTAGMECASIEWVLSGSHVDTVSENSVESRYRVPLDYFGHSL